jgi:hypothetical protein
MRESWLCQSFPSPRSGVEAGVKRVRELVPTSPTLHALGRLRPGRKPAVRLKLVVLSLMPPVLLSVVGNSPFAAWPGCTSVSS